MSYQTILLFGAGKSTTCLINYLLDRSEKNHWKLFVVDADIEAAKEKTSNHPNALVGSFDIKNDDARKKSIADAAIVISMLPPALHFLVAKDCITYRKNLLTASYLDPQIQSLEKDIQKQGLLFICEMGLDPGIDHMSAMHLINHIKNENGNIRSFKSYCGGLIAPEYDNNPWHYKISWNPLNIVNAGKSGAVYKYKGEVIHKDYGNIFDVDENIFADSTLSLGWYPNRDSLSYIQLYGLEEADTFIRATFRHPDYIKGWRYIVDAGLTNDADQDIFNTLKKHSIRDWFLFHINKKYGVHSYNDYISFIIPDPLKLLIHTQFEFLDFLKEYPIPQNVNTSAELLRFLLEKNLVLTPHDKDLVILLHEIIYQSGDDIKQIKKVMIAKGENNKATAMAKTVGLPLAIATELLLGGQIKLTGTHIPVIAELYQPILLKLEENRIIFRDIE